LRYARARLNILGFMIDILRRVGSMFGEFGYFTVVEIIVLLLYVLLYSKISRLSSRVKESLMGHFSLNDIKKDSEIKRACIELTTNVNCSNTMIFRLHNGESAGDFFHFKRCTALFDEPRRGSRLQLPNWQNVSYGIFADRMQRLFNDGQLHGHISDIDGDESYRAFHKDKGLYYEILLPIHIRDGNKNHPFGYIACFFNREQADRLRGSESKVKQISDEMRSVRGTIENTLAQKADGFASYLPEAFGYGVE